MNKNELYNCDVFNKYSDEELINIIRDGNSIAQEYLIDKYKNLVKIKSRSYFILGADREDIIQEGMIGLYKAIRDFKPEKQANFYSFAELCIVRQVITAIKSANRQKHIPLNSYLSLNKTVYDENDECTYLEMLTDNVNSNPETLFIGNENKQDIEKKMSAVLSKLEQEVLNLYLNGKSYHEIAKIIERDEKSIDNALQRVKKKVEKILCDRIKD